ncbi:hypothetical protein P3X46_003664 [Hevea brasiliensis]|uniref:Uncharacterized protein n=1 Tax=Hevea brasiliensis TaxID=3981 RepID=A0ABQ9N7S9_HEVBR|nr:hypothetical protein P3X46_003664 [Hevea brasiliensis]
MASSFSYSSSTPRLNSHHRTIIFPPNYHGKINIICCNGKNPSGNSPARQESEPENAVLKLAWYGSELLGIAASFFRSPSTTEAPQGERTLGADGLGSIERAMVVDVIKEDFQRSYFVTGNLTLNAYEEDCEFADPAGSFRGLARFKRNCTNFGLLIEKSNMKLTKWEDYECFPLENS